MRTTPVLARLELPLLALAAGGAWLAHSAWNRYAALPEVPLAAPQPDLPPVTIIVPARNEEENLQILLPTLRRQEYPCFDVLVVDDDSSDRTGAVAMRHGARVLRLSGPPRGWTGKCHACWQGAQAAGGEWLLFTDADTAHGPATLASAVQFAQATGADALTLTLRQRCLTFWERLLVPYAFQALFASASPAALADPKLTDAMLNGQFILVRRAAYLAAGGHAAVRSSIIEDLALARHLKVQGLRVLGGRGEHLACVRMYRGFAALRAGFTKNAFAFLAAGPRAAWRTGAAATLGGLPALLLLAALLRALRTRRLRGDLSVAAGLAGWMMASFARWLHLSGVPPALAVLQPLAALTFQTISLPSTWRSLTGRGLEWKGRVYAGPSSGLHN